MFEHHSKKKTCLYKEKDEVKRKQYIESLSKLSSEKVIYLDESGINSFISRVYCWSKKSLKVIGEISGNRYARQSFIVGLVNNQVIAPFCYKGTCDTILFNYWLENILLPNIGPGYCLIMDNATFHKSEQTHRLVEQAGCQILFLPPYSPDLNPIKKLWANIKDKIKRVIARFTSLEAAVDYVFQSIS